MSDIKRGHRGRTVDLPVSFHSSGFVSKTKQNELLVTHIESFLDEHHMWDFVTSSMEVFLTVQKEADTYYPDPVPQNVVTSLSRTYRSFLLDMCARFKEEGNLVQAELYSNLDFIWNFCEIMFLSSHPELPVLPYLIDWIKINFDNSSEMLRNIVDELPDLSSESTDALWSIIYAHVIHGCSEEAGRLLSYLKMSNESKVFERQVGLLGELLEKKPIYIPNQSSISEFEALFTAWQEECRNRLEQSVFHGNDQFTFVCKVLCGDDAAFAEVVERIQITWFEYLVMMITYKYPTIRPAQLSTYAKKTINLLDYSKSLSARDMIILHAMDFCITDILKEMQEIWNNSWFLLHFCDLVYAGGASLGAENFDFEVVPSLRNEFIKTYGMDLMLHPTFWKTGVLYLDTLPDHQGKSIIRELLQRIQPSSESKADELIHVAEKFGFGREITSICRQVSLYKLKHGQIQNALLWAIKAGDGALATKVVDSIIFEGDCEIDSSLMDSLKEIVPCADRLAFFSGFCDFRKALVAKDLKMAMKHFKQLVNDDLIPKRIAHKIMLSLEKYLSSNTDILPPGDSLFLLTYLHTNISNQYITKDEREKINKTFMSHRMKELSNVFQSRKRELEGNNIYI